MISIPVTLKRIIDDSYRIQFGNTISEVVNDIVHSGFGNRYFIVTDSTVHKLYGNTLEKGLKSHNLQVFTTVIPPGEEKKNRNTKDIIENKLLSKKAGRDSVIIALGGGVVGDIAGFVAATLLRGIPYIQIPTTLLAQVDSSIGGKVAVDHPLGKNLIGAFFQPKKVYIVPSMLKTLSDREFANGMAEVIKYAAIMDPKLFSFLENNSLKVKRKNSSSLMKIIKRCCELKRNVVQKDEKETGLRRILNFGHTVGHAVESLMNYQMPHGKAVAIGMVAEAKISSSLGLLPEPQLSRLETLIQLYNLPTSIPPSLNLSKLFAATLTDKKAINGVVHYTLLEKIGKARVGEKLSHKNALKLFLQ